MPYDKKTREIADTQSRLKIAYDVLWGSDLKINTTNAKHINKEISQAKMHISNALNLAKDTLCYYAQGKKGPLILGDQDIVDVIEEDGRGFVILKEDGEE